MHLAEILPPSPEPTKLWKLAAQAGIQCVVGGLPGPADCRGGERPWEYLPLLRMKQRYESAGFELGVIEARPPLNNAKRGLPDGEAEIDTVCQLIENMGRLGIPVWCYEWMTDFNWMRTNIADLSRGGSLVSSFDYGLIDEAPPTDLGPVSEEQLWNSLETFLRKVLPVAEKAGVQIAMHPDDPPLSPIREVSRIMRSVDNFQRLLELAPSPANGITFCQGNFRLMTPDITGAIQKFGRQQKIFFVHFRDVDGTPEKFSETWHDSGPTDMYECVRAYKSIDFSGLMRPDHVPTVEGDSNENPGYSPYGRLYAIGYIRGLIEAADHHDE